MSAFRALTYDGEDPTPPTNIVASNITQTTLTLNWTASTDNIGVVGYEVYQDGNVIGTVANPTINIGGLIVGTTYQFSVYAKDNYGNMSLPSNINVTTLVGGGACIEEIIDSNDFEISSGIWQGFGNHAKRVQNNNFANLGVYCALVRWNKPTSNLTTNNVYNLSSYEEIAVSFSYATDRIENGESFFLELSTDGGSTYTTMRELTKGVDFENRVRKYDTIVRSGPFTNNCKLRFRTDGDQYNDVVYLDDITITGCSNGGGGAGNIGVSIATQEDIDLDMENITIYPNPVSQILNIQNLPENIRVKLVNLSGQLLIDQTGNAQVDMSELNSGMYILQVINEERINEESSKVIKVIKQ